MPYNPGVQNEGGRYIMQGILAATQALQRGLDRRAEMKMRQKEIDMLEGWKGDASAREWADYSVRAKEAEPFTPTDADKDRAAKLGYLYMPQSHRGGTWMRANDPNEPPKLYSIPGVGNVIDLGGGKRSVVRDPASPLPSAASQKIQSNLDANARTETQIAGYQKELDSGNQYEGWDWWKRLVGNTSDSYRTKIDAGRADQLRRTQENEEIKRTFKSRPSGPMPGYTLPARTGTPPVEPPLPAQTLDPTNSPAPTPAPALRLPTPTPPPAPSGGGSALPPSRVYKDEAEARAAGHASGDEVMMINPATGQPGRARLH